MGDIFLVRLGQPPHGGFVGMLHRAGNARTPTQRERDTRRFFRTACGRDTNPTEWESPRRYLALKIKVPVCAVCFPAGAR